MTAREAGIRWRWFRKSFSDFLAFFWSFRAFFGQFCPILAPNSKLLQTSHVTTQNDCKRSRNPMKMVLDVIIQTFTLISVIWGLFGHFCPILAPNSKLMQTSHVTAQNDRKRSRNPMEMIPDDTF